MQFSKHLYTLISFVFIIVVLGLAFISDRIGATNFSAIKTNQVAEKLYVALEEDGAIAVIDTKDNSLLGKIDLSENKGGKTFTYSAHNVQVAPDGKSVWVTANFMGLGGHEEQTMTEGEDEDEVFPDQVVIIDPQKDTIKKRIEIGTDQHLAHVVVTKDGKRAYVTAQEPGLVYQVNGTSFTVDKQIPLEKDAQPHGLRLSGDDTFAYVALIGAKGIGILDTSTGKVSKLALAGNVVQTATIPNTPYVAASVYDTKQIAFYNPTAKELSYVSLPPEAEGPVQLYATPDGKYLYVADQGYYFGKPTSDYVYKIDVVQKQVVSKIQAGVAPHGTVVSSDGKRAYITNLLSGNVSLIDTSTDKEITKINVGKMPNGISLWSHQFGGTP